MCYTEMEDLQPEGGLEADFHIAPGSLSLPMSPIIIHQIGHHCTALENP